MHLLPLAADKPVSTPKPFSGKLRASCVAAALTIMAVASASAAPMLTNGSLEGPIANDTPPPGWTANPTPDTIDQNHNAYDSAFAATPSASANGGTWAGLAATTFTFLGTNFVINEAIKQTVSGFTVGSSYTLSWYHANFGATGASCPAGCTADNAIQVLADGVAVGSGSVLAIGTNWVEDSVTFVAADTDLDLTFQSLLTSNYSYQSIDGIRLTEVPVVPPNAVPEPAALSLFSGAGLAMVLASRRRKKAKAAAA